MGFQKGRDICKCLSKFKNPFLTKFYVPNLRCYFKEELPGFTDGEVGELSCHLAGKRDSETFLILAVITFLFYLFIKIRIYCFPSVWQTLTWIKQSGHNLIKWLLVLKILQEWTKFTGAQHHGPLQFTIAKLWLADLIPVSACLVCCTHLLQRQISQRSAAGLCLDLLKKLGSYKIGAEWEIKDAEMRGNVVR